LKEKGQLVGGGNRNSQDQKGAARGQAGAIKKGGKGNSAASIVAKGKVLSFKKNNKTNYKGKKGGGGSGQKSYLRGTSFLVSEESRRFGEK